MSLFPDRSIIPAQSHELTLFDPGLTNLQKKQLSRITGSYMKECGLIGYENTRAVLPVIRHCVIEGLRLIYQRDQILPADNLDAVFKKGYTERNAVLSVVQTEIEGLTGQAGFEGALALPQALIRAASEELRMKTLLPDLRAGKTVMAEAQKRRPIFQHAVRFCRDKVEEDIPGSKQVRLTAVQQSALVRHLVFSWVVFGEPRILLETEDFMVNKQDYINAPSGREESRWEELARLVGYEGEESIQYLQDISVQIADLLATVPNYPQLTISPLEIATTINTAFKKLESHFLVVNPFNKLPSLSENPGDKGRSIWDDNRSGIITVGGAVYRIPTMATLNLAAYLISGQDPKRSDELRTGARAVDSFIIEVSKQNTDRTIPLLQAEVAEYRHFLAQLKEATIQGSIPEEAAINLIDVLKLTQGQNRLMTDEMQFFHFIRSQHSNFIELGLGLLKRYQNGDIITGTRDFQRLQRLYFSAADIRRDALHYIRERITPRVRALNQISGYLKRLEILPGVWLPDFLKGNSPKNLDVTVLDMLDFRNRFWMIRLLNPRITLPEAYTFEDTISSAITQWTRTKRVITESKEVLDWSLNETDENYAAEDKVSDSPGGYLLERSKRPFGPAKIILNFLAKLCPEDMWPTYSVTIHGVAYNIYPDEKHDRYTDPAYNRHVLGEFRNWLDKNKFTFTDEVFDSLVSSANIGDLINNGHHYHRLLGIEQQVNDWFRGQHERLFAQVKEYKPEYYKVDPARFIGQKEQTLYSKERKLRHMEKSTTTRLEVLIGRLRNLGIIKADTPEVLS